MTIAEKPETAVEIAEKTAGRPTLYRDEFCEQAERLARIGLIDVELAEFFEVSEATINNWKKEHPRFLESIRAGKRTMDANVESRLLKRALGYEFTETKRCNGELTEFERHCPADVRAQQFWLTNRQPEKWRNRTDVKADVNVSERVDNQLLKGRQKLRDMLSARQDDVSESDSGRYNDRADVGQEFPTPINSDSDNSSE